MKTENSKYTTHSPEETFDLGRKIGSLIDDPIVLALSGDLGSGKTVFVQGLARGLEVQPEYYITSPTFTLVNEYPGRLRLFHIDLYRLDHFGDLEDIGLHYATTLNRWRENFFDRLPEVKAQGFSDTFIRMWDYYLCYCEGAFLERAISDVQILFAKPGCRLKTI